MKESRYKREDGWYLDLNSNGDICWYNDITGEEGECWQSREEAEGLYSSNYDDSPLAYG